MKDDILEELKSKIVWLKTDKLSDDDMTYIDISLDYMEYSELNKELLELSNLEMTRKFSILRANLIEWLPYKESDDVLLIGEDTSVLSKGIMGKCHSIICVNTTAVGAYLSQQALCEMIESSVICGDIEQAMDYLTDQKFDYIIFTDFIKIPKRMSIEKSDFMQQLRRTAAFLTPNGKVLSASPNALGLKYWHGCMDECENSFFSGIENYSGLSEYGYPDRSDIDEITKLSGFSYSKMFYPYPDAWFPMAIYSDDFLPSHGELTKNAFPWEKRIVLFNEVNAWNTIVKNNWYDKMANAFLLILSNKELEGINIFTKYSNDRGESYSIRTDIFKDNNGASHVIKRGMTDDAKQHLKKMLNWEEKLTEIYDGKLKINRLLWREEESLEVEYLQGKSLSDILSDLLDKDDFEGFVAIFDEFVRILSDYNREDFVVTDEFAQIFGDIDLPKGLYAGKINNIDLIVPNIIITDNDMNVIDYEWTFDFPIPINFCIYRSIEYFFRGPRNTSNYNRLYMYDLLDRYNISDEECNAYNKMEANFQKYICEEHVPLRDIGRQRPINIFPDNPQIYFDFGKGFSKKNCHQIAGRMNDKMTKCYRIGIPNGVRNIRFDPSCERCMVTLRSLYFENEDDQITDVLTNGCKLAEKTYIFNTDDSQIIVKNIARQHKVLNIEIEIVEISEELAAEIENRITEGM